MSQGFPPGPPQRTIRPLQPRRGLAEDVYDAILEQLMDQVIAPGSRVSIDGLARDLNVSPTPVREALARLEAEDLVMKVPLKGYTAAPLIEDDDITALFEVRELLEPIGARRAAGRITPLVLDELREHARLIEDQAQVASPARDGGRFEGYRVFVEHDAAFHQRIAESSGNPFLAEAIVRIRPHLQLYRRFFVNGVAPETSAEHWVIVRALEAGSPERAEAAMRTHIQGLFRRIRP